MNKKIIIAIAGTLTVIISMIIGWFIGDRLSPTAFIVCDYCGSITTYTVRFGQIRGATMSISTGVKPLEINLDGVNNTTKAVEEIERQVREQGGNIISVSQGS